MISSNLTAKQILRNFKLSILSDTELEEPYKSLYINLKNIFKDLNKYKITSKVDIYYGKSCSHKSMYIKYLNDKIYVDADNVWNMLFTHTWVDESFNIKRKIIRYFINETLGIDGEILILDVKSNVDFMCKYYNQILEPLDISSVN